MKRKVVILLTSCPKEKGDELSRIIMQSHLVSCLQMSKIKSYFWWKGELDSQEEVLLVCKTQKSNKKKLKALIFKHHCYEVPEILCLSAKASKKYYKWHNQVLSAFA